MKRDWGCVRAILLALEEKGDVTTALHPSQVAGYSADDVVYHMGMLESEGLIRAKCQRIHGEVRFAVAFELSWAGHDFLGTLKSSKVWNRILAVAREAGVELGVDTIKSLAPACLQWVLKQVSE